MQFGRYQFHCRLTSDAILPEYKGSTFRGAFGTAFKQVVCALKHQTCTECLLINQCLYAKVFETPITANPGNNHVPHPFVIEPPLTSQTHYSAGSDFDFNLLLFGDYNDSLPYFIYAFDQMGKVGIGKKINHQRAGFVLENVSCNGAAVYSAKTKQLLKPHEPGSLTLDPDQSRLPNINRLSMTLLTPLRIKYENRLKADLPFHVLVRAMLRRISSLLNAYGEGEPPLDYRGLIQRAESVRIVEDHLKWADWQRYSLRQDQAMLMGGITGTVTYEGEIGEFMPLVDFCVQTHLGKQTTFGLGLIRGKGQDAEK
jgi:hypothetical protein